jgi:hypothetical protein
MAWQYFTVDYIASGSFVQRVADGRTGNRQLARMDQARALSHGLGP